MIGKSEKGGELRADQGPESMVRGRKQVIDKACPRGEAKGENQEKIWGMEGS